MTTVQAKNNSVSIGEKSRLIYIEGEVTESAEPRIMESFAQASPKGVRCSVLDFSGIRFLNGAGVSLLVKLNIQAKKQGHDLKAFGLSNHYQNVFKLTRLDKAIEIYDSKAEVLVAVGEPAGSPLYGENRERNLNLLSRQSKQGSLSGATCWAQPVSKLKVPEMPTKAINLNVEGRRVVGPVEGFGQMWQKTYRLRLVGAKTTPAEAIAVLKENFPKFQPPENHFYPSSAGIKPGEIVLIDSSTPGGPVYTGVMILYADDLSFTFITPQGHPESGWVTFTAFEENGATVIQIQGLARASDPVYEIAFRLAGSKLQERIWRHVLTSLANHLGANPEVQVQKTCIDTGMQWSEAKNIWYNAQIRSLLYTMSAPLRRVRNKTRR